MPPTMPPTQVDEALEEIDDLIAEFEPQLEGLYDFRRLNLLPATLQEVAVSIEQYERRVLMLKEAKRILELLVRDGHPALAVREIPPEAQADLAANAGTIELALAKFSAGAASSLGLRGGLVEQK